jgi:hypothetical protein
MRRIDELHLELAFYGSRRMMFELNKGSRRPLAHASAAC